MAHLFRMAPAVVVAAAGAFLLSASAADKTAADNPAGGAAAARAWDGRIASVDPGRREVTLADVRVSPSATGTDKERGTTPDKSTASDKTTADRAAGADRPAGSDRGTATGDRAQTMTFEVAENAKITLDGKPAELRELKSDMYARVYVQGGESGTTRDKGAADRAPASDRPATGADRDRAATPGVGARMMTDRIEARTKTGSDAGGGKDRGTETKDR